MKTQAKSILITSVLFLLSSLLTINSKAQCSTKISNNLSCDVIVNIVVYDTGGGCTNICNSQLGAGIPANSMININCGGCGTVCKIEVTIIDVNGNSINVTTDTTSGTPQSITSCNGMGTNTFVYDSGGDTFKIY